MICVKPYFTGGAAFGCGQCMPCRFNKRRLWAHRIQLEALNHAQSSFVTLTYASDDVRSLVPRDLTLWLKRLRKHVVRSRVDHSEHGRSAFRYFAVGEYGDQTERPHYHAALFGFPSCSHAVRVVGEACPCPPCSAVRKTWGFGHVLVGSLTPHSAGYLAGYVTKKLTSASDTRLHGRHPEFARMSLRPGIGADAMWDVASVMMQYRLSKVPTQLRHGSKLLPLGRYLRSKLASMMDAEVDASFTDERLRLVRAYAFENSRSLSECWQEFAAPAALQLEKQVKAKKRSL